jgi:hypothetical protein
VIDHKLEFHGFGDFAVMPRVVTSIYKRILLAAASRRARCGSTPVFDGVGRLERHGSFLMHQQGEHTSPQISIRW